VKKKEKREAAEECVQVRYGMVWWVLNEFQEKRRRINSALGEKQTMLRKRLRANFNTFMKARKNFSFQGGNEE
jgi:hypothetical protein